MADDEPRRKAHLEQHVAVSAAAAVAYGELVPQGSRKPYDAEHMAQMLDIVAAALARLAPIYVADAASRARLLSANEIAGMKISRGAVDRGQEVTITHRGKARAKLVPIRTARTSSRAARKLPLFGIWKDRADIGDVAAYVERLRSRRS